MVFPFSVTQPCSSNACTRARDRFGKQDVRNLSSRKPVSASPTVKICCVLFMLYTYPVIPAQAGIHAKQRTFSFMVGHRYRPTAV